MKAPDLRDRRVLVTALLIGLYVICQVPVYFSSAMVPDEAFFLAVAMDRVREIDAAQGWGSLLFTQGNDLGYGALYWLVYVGLVKLAAQLGIAGQEALTALRGLALAAMASIPLVILLQGLRKRSPFTLPAIALWLSLPVAWWSGKVTGPEVFSLAAAVIGLHLATTGQEPTEQRRRLWGWLLMGLSIGIKVNALPVLLFAAIATFSLKRLASLWVVPVGAGLGFLLANPFVLKAPQRFVETLNAYKYPADVSWKHLAFILSNQRWEWDVVLAGGLFQWTFPIPLFLLFVLTLFVVKVPLRTLLAVGLAQGFALLMFLSNGRFYGWYWFPLLAVYPLLLIDGTRHTRTRQWLCYALVALSIGCNLPSIQLARTLKFEHEQNLREAPAVQAAVTAAIEGSPAPFDEVVNMSEINVYLDAPSQAPGPIKFLAAYEWERHLRDATASHLLFAVGNRVSRIEPYRGIKRQLEGDGLQLGNKTYRTYKQLPGGFATLYLVKAHTSKESAR